MKPETNASALLDTIPDRDLPPDSERRFRQARCLTNYRLETLCDWCDMLIRTQQVYFAVTEDAGAGDWKRMCAVCFTRALKGGL